MSVIAGKIIKAKCLSPNLLKRSTLRIPVKLHGKRENHVPVSIHAGYHVQCQISTGHGAQDINFQNYYKLSDVT